MPSPLHQTVVDLLRHAPEVVPRLLAVVGIATTEGATVQVLDAVLDQIERRVDLVFEVTWPEVAKVAVGFEIQLGIRAEKRRSWPVYLTSMRTRECPLACLVIVTPDRRVATWAAQPIDLGPGNEKFRVHVLGPEQIPRIFDSHMARQQPELAFLSALAHANSDSDAKLVRAAMAGLDTLDRDRARSYSSVLLAHIDSALGAALETAVIEELEDGERSPSTVSPEFVEKALAWGRRMGEKRISPLEARQEGLEVGMLVGALLARRQVLVRLLACAGLQPNATEARQIDQCNDPAILDRWIEQALGATSVSAALQ